MRQKDHSARLNPSFYPHCFEHQTIYADMDAFRHINNGAIGRYFEEGRAALNRLVFGENVMTNPPGELQLLFASVSIEYLAQVNYPGSVRIASGIGRIGNSSWDVVQAGFQNNNCVALALATMVKAEAGKPVALTDEERGVLLDCRFRELN